MAHNSPCENAKSPKCRCSGCGGSLHGWPGHLLLAQRPSEDRDALRSAADQSWFSALGPEGGRAALLKKPNIPMKRAAADRAVADIVDWLAGDDDKIKRVATIGRLISEDTLKDLDAYAEKGTTDNRDLLKLRSIIPGHFWCSLLADLSGAADTAHGNLEKIPGQAQEALLGSEEQPGWGDVQRYVAGFTLAAIWTYVKPLAVTWDLESLVRIMRILAVLICPDPGRHPRVARLCLSPLVKDVITETAESRLHQSFGAALDPVWGA
ncbi:hypothetical protein HDA32_005825 [Spinactinospora alkalitolerans]|uniref:Uncharacterized protein n=1 Tax=Spinactinospora alkalitolerans TaxID=687207 RepID=A0A852U571_9ACTN|nr:hypothetical protein [Spinactinospora alkalitolerans]NYE50705.1 hypothetical protein [Spinactinospora alkalitolerans]